MQVREKVGKSRNTVFFHWFVAQEGRKVGSLKRRVRSQLARWEMNNCTPLWREAHVQVKMYKTHQNTSTSDHFWKLRCRKSARRRGTKLPNQNVQSTPCSDFGPLLEVVMSKKYTPLWREAHFKVKSAKNWGVRSTFGRSHVVSRGRRRGLCTLSKVSKTCGLCSSFKNDGRRGAFEEDLERWISRGRRSTRDTWGKCVRRSRRRFPEERLHIGAWDLQDSSGLLRWFCVTSAALRMTWLHFFVAGAVL